MPRLSEATKDVVSCEKLGIGTHELIPRCPNGATRLVEDQSPAVRREQTRRTETSKYPEEKKSKRFRK